VSRFSGPQMRGALQQARARKRKDANRRNALTPPTGRRRYREGSPKQRAAMTADLAEASSGETS
jgi:hypothetical protein